MHSEMAGQQERMPQATIANITEQHYMAHRMYGTFQIAGRGEETKFAVTRVSPRTAVMDYGDKRTLPLAITAREIAQGGYLPQKLMRTRARTVSWECSCARATRRPSRS